jgi:hypothetical protein
LARRSPPGEPASTSRLSHQTSDDENHAVENEKTLVVPKSTPVDVARMIKVVYFDEQSASDYLDISAGGKASEMSEDVRKRITDMHAKVETSVTAKLSWLPFFGAAAETGAGMGVSRAGQSILSKTLSNTILTDYLERVAGDTRVRRLEDLQVSAPKDSMAFMKMYTPYMIIARTEDHGIDLARMDEALETAKGYYELLGEDPAGQLCVLRFNIKAFRNNYGLADLSRMDLVYHGIKVGRTTEASLSMSAEMSQRQEAEAPTALELIDGATGSKPSMLDVFDVVLAGVEHER